MQAFLEKSNRFLDAAARPRRRGSSSSSRRSASLAAYLFPLWNLTMFAPQYPEGLRLDIYSYKLEGGNDGQDVKEINVLNHYIGMRDLERRGLHRVQVDPVRRRRSWASSSCAPPSSGTMAHLVDVLVLYVYFGALLALVVRLQDVPATGTTSTRRRP